MGLPFSQTNINNNSFLRKFSSDIAEDELYWHKDERDRVITVLSGNNWMFQEEDSLPVALLPGDMFRIKKDSWHRVIRGDGPLEILVREI